MALFGRAKHRRRARVLTAAGTRIDLNNRESVRRLAQSRTAQTWQADAWGYRDMIGELRFANEFVARAVARVKFFPAQNVPDEDEPIAFDNDQATIPPALASAAEEELARLPLDAGYRFIGVMVENLKITGECWLHGYTDDAGEEQWEVLSVSEVILGQDGQISIRRHGEGINTPVDPDGEEEMLRLWVPHPRWSNLADSPMRALQDVCEDIILAGRESRAVSRSRIATNGLFKIPRGLSLLMSTRDDTMVSADDDGFLAELTAALTAPIMNEGHPGAVAPAAVVGELEDLAGFEHMRIDRDTSEEILGKVEQSLSRLARGLDIPPEIITGMADANHWTAWQIDSSTYRYHIDPTVRTVADALTEAFLRPALIARGFTAADARQVVVWRDAGVLTENPNRGQDAKDAFDRGSIGFKALNEALGFTEGDMPDDDELVRMIALKVGVDTGTSALLLRAALGTQAVPEPPQPVVVQPPRQIPSQRVEPGQTPPDGTDATPATEPPGMTAAGRALVQAILADTPSDDDYILDADGSRALGDIDRVLMDRVLVAAEEALERGLEKAGARVRSKANGKPAMRAAIDGTAVTHMAAVIGPEGVLKLGLKEQDLLAGVFDRLAANWTAWVNAGIAEGARVVLRMLGLSRTSPEGQAVADRIRRDMSARVPQAWAWLHDQLMATAARVLYAPDEPATGRGETSRFRVPPGIVRRALGMVGGAPPDADASTPDVPTGIGSGATITDTLTAHGAAQLGFEWIYGVADRNTFEPHLDLDGERFTTWSDDRLVPPPAYSWVGPYMHPGDHLGCQCMAQYVWITPTQPQTELSNRRTLADRVRAFRDRWLRRGRG